MRFWVKILIVFASFAFLISSSAYAGKVELTTYYPSPNGEYSSLQATTTLKVPVVTSTSTPKTVATTTVGEIWVETA